MLLNKSIPAVKFIRTLVLLSVMLLAGCDYGDRQFDEDRTKALQNPDAFQAYQQLNKDAEKNCHPGVFRATCSEEVHTAYQELALSVYRTALNRRSPQQATRPPTKASGQNRAAARNLPEETAVQRAGLTARPRDTGLHPLPGSLC